MEANQPLTSTLDVNAPPFLRGGGEMGTLIRHYDWTQTPLGSPFTWPQSLRTTLSILLNSKFPMFLFWGNDLICFYNDAYRPSLGQDGRHPSTLGKPGAEAWPESWPIIKPLIDQVLAGGEASWSEDQLVPIYRNGGMEDVYWTFSYSPVSDESGVPAGVFVTCTETTDKVNTLRQLQTSTQLFQNLVSEASVGIIVLSGAEMTVRVVNDAYARLIDRRCDELREKPFFSVIPEAEAVFRPLLDTVRLTGEPLHQYGQPYSVRVGNETKTGFLNLVYQPYREQDGSLTGVMVICQDVTGQKKAEEALTESEIKLRSVIDSAPFPIGVYVGRDMRIQLANESILSVWGKGRDVTGKRYAEVLPELENQEIFAQLDTVYTTGTPFHAKNQRVDIVVDGILQPYYFNYSFTPLYDAEGRVYGVMNTAAEITDLVLAWQKIEESETALRGAIELAKLAAWRMDIETGRFTYSQRFMDWLGFSESTKDIDEAYNPLPDEYQQPVADAIAAVIQPGSSGFYENEYPIINRLTGQVRIIHAQGQVLLNAAGLPALLSGTAQDVTEQRKIQLALEQQVRSRTEELAAANEELAATNEELATTNEELMATNEELIESTQLLVRSNENLQRFAYVASHDLQEPLRKIQSFGDLLKQQYADQLGEGADHLERMRSAASRMSVLIKDLLSFSRISIQQDNVTPVSLNEVLNSVLTDLELRIQETGATIQVTQLPTVRGDRSQLGQLFQNLLSNALKFLKVDAAGVPIPPQIRVYSQRVVASALPASMKPTRLAAVYYRINVSDNGIGFDDKYVDRIFQVFQRLHGRNQFAGTGVGLAICEKVATNHGGAITATSQPGRGATFSVYLPM